MAKAVMELGTTLAGTTICFLAGVVALISPPKAICVGKPLGRMRSWRETLSENAPAVALMVRSASPILSPTTMVKTWRRRPPAGISVWSFGASILRSPVAARVRARSLSAGRIVDGGDGQFDHIARGDLQRELWLDEEGLHRGDGAGGGAHGAGFLEGVGEDAQGGDGVGEGKGGSAFAGGVGLDAGVPIDGFGEIGAIGRRPVGAEGVGVFADNDNGAGTDEGPANSHSILQHLPRHHGSSGSSPPGRPHLPVAEKLHVFCVVLF